MADIGAPPFSMQPQRKPVGLFNSPLPGPARSGGNPGNSISGGGGSPTGGAVGAAPPLGKFPSSPRPLPGSGPMPGPMPVGGPIRSFTLPPVGPSPTTSAPPAAGGAAPTPFTPQPNVTVPAAPYNYTGPTMNLLGMTDAPGPALSAPAAPVITPPFGGGGGGALNGIFGAGRGRPLFL